MKFVPTGNFKTMCRRAMTNNAVYSFVDTAGNTRTLYQPNGNYTYCNGMPFFNNLVAQSPWTAATGANTMAYASSDETISLSATAPANVVGSCSCQATAINNNGGWEMTITVTSNADADINSFYFTRCLYTANSSTANNEALIYGVELDSTVHLTNDNNHTATFVFAIEF